MWVAWGGRCLGSHHVVTTLTIIMSLLSMAILYPKCSSQNGEQDNDGGIDHEEGGRMSVCLSVVCLCVLYV